MNLTSTTELIRCRRKASSNWFTLRLVNWISLEGDNSERLYINLRTTGNKHFGGCWPQFSHLECGASFSVMDFMWTLPSVVYSAANICWLGSFLKYGHVSIIEMFRLVLLFKLLLFEWHKVTSGQSFRRLFFFTWEKNSRNSILSFEKKKTGWLDDHVWLQILWRLFALLSEVERKKVQSWCVPDIETWLN